VDKNKGERLPNGGRPIKNIDIKEAVEIIKNPSQEYVKKIEYLRTLTNDDEKRNFKGKQLDYARFQGIFSYMDAKSLIKASELLCIDLDHAAVDVKELKKALATNNYVHVAFVSPSGDGLKIILKIPESNIETYPRRYLSAYEYFLDNYNTTVKYSPTERDIARACFLSYDPEIYFNIDSEIYVDIKEKNEPREQTTKKRGKEVDRSSQEFGEVCKKIKEGKTDEEIIEEMMSSEKWKESTPHYREVTLKNAHKKCEKEKKEDDEEAVHTSFIADDENKIMYEQVRQKDQNLYCRFDYCAKEIIYVNEAKIKDVVYKPNNGEEIDKKNIKSLYLPSEAVDCGDIDSLNKEIITFINKWLDIPTEVQIFALWNIKLSWIYDRLHTVNYLRARGDSGLGKSRFLDTIGALHYKALYTAGSSTSAVIFRLINKWQGTMIIDEADFKKSDESEDIIKIINQGYEKGRPIYRCDELFHDKIKVYDVYGPKILATRKVFQDKAVESRCMTHIMTGTNRKDIKFTLNDSFYRESLAIRNKLLMWRFKNYFEIDCEKDIPFDISYLEPRLQQIGSGYFHIFTTEKEIEDFKKYLEEKQRQIVEERANSFDGEVVSAIHGLYVNKGIREFSTSDIIEEGDLKDYNNNQLKARNLTSHLKGLGIEKTIIKKINGKTKRILILNEDALKMLFARYNLAIDTKTEDTQNNIFGINTVVFEDPPVTK
jgi:hypothetical protein